jgi:hypothetical protein
MAAKKKRTKRAPKRRAKTTAHRVSRPKSRTPKAPKRVRSTVRATSDSDLSKLYASAVRAGEASALRRVRAEMRRRAELGELDSVRFHVPADVVREGRAVLSPKRRR